MNLTNTRTGGSEGAGLSDVSSLPREASAGRLPTGGIVEIGAVLDLPVPPSVNRTRRGDFWVGTSRLKKWHAQADRFALAGRYRPLRMERFELHITFSEKHTKMDLDNGVKALIDYLRWIEAIVDDAPANLRRLVVEWGDAPEGVRVQIVPWRKV